MLLKTLRDEIDATLARDPAARSRLEVVLCYPGFQALLFHRVGHWLWARGWFLAGRFVAHLGRMATAIDIHPGAAIGKRLFIDHGVGVVIGETAEIGDDCTLYQGVTLGGTRPSVEQAGQKRHPTLGNCVIVSSGAQVLGPFKVGDGARIGASAVVLREVPEGATMVGNPARQVTRRRASDSTPPPFEPYGVTGDIPDPIARALNGLVEEVAGLRARLAELERAAAPPRVLEGGVLEGGVLDGRGLDGRGLDGETAPVGFARRLHTIDARTDGAGEDG
ncbi:MAG: serine O-acetyltransferase [Alphaproteobacteria bacterium]|nr:serine O-acetyltransferase [Alphaproteobacteria bacterium]